ncbi:FGGY-family carbohydrate kinase [Chloroflexota bacterium]
MPHKRLLAIDAGTSGVRCLVTSLEGQPVSLSHRGWAYETPAHIAPLGREFDATRFWDIICQGIREAIEEGNVNAGDIVGVSTTSQREGIVFLDKGGKELYAAPNIDLRALLEGLSLDRELGEEIYAISGHKPSFLFAPAKLKWFESNCPETYSRIATVLAISDWVTYRLCGERVSEVSAASELGLVDIRECAWSGRLRELLGLPVGIYPELRTVGSCVGEVTAQAAADTGLIKGTPIALGGADTQSGLLGMGVKEKGEVGVVAGWSAPVQMVTAEAIIDRKAMIWSSCHIFPGRWILESNAGEAGSAYSWLKDTMFGELGAEEAYARMDDLAEQVPVGSEGVLALLGPAAMDMNRLGLKLGGLLLPVPLSAGGCQKSHLVRAVLENLCFAIKANCLQIENISGMAVKGISVGGGLSQSGCLTQMLPSVLNSPVFVSGVPNVTGLGAAIIAAVGAGVYSSLEEAVSSMKIRGEVIEPDPLIAAEYSEYYERWAAAAHRLEELSEEVQ